MTRSTRKWFRHGTFWRCSPHRQLIVSRRRWESNPLDAALQAAATPCDISVIQCPCQASNLIYDLRRVVCIHHTPRTDLCSLPNARLTLDDKTFCIAH